MNGPPHKLPPSPPLSPLMTNHLARIDEWRHQVEHEHPVGSTQESGQSWTNSDSSVRPIPQLSRGLPGFQAHSPAHYSHWDAYETTKYAPIAPAVRPVAPVNQAVASTGLPRVADPHSIIPDKASERDELHVENEDIELSDLEPEDEPVNGSVTVAELRAHNRRLKRFR